MSEPFVAILPEPGSPLKASRWTRFKLPKLEPRILRYQLSDYAWDVIKPMLPNQLRDIPQRIDLRSRYRTNTAIAHTIMAAPTLVTIATLIQ